MEKMKCSFNEHKNIEAIKLCSDCKIYMCNKCEKLHSGLFLNHHLFNVDQNINDIFSGFCKEENHFEKLDYFCKTHNLLCCSSCIVKVKKKGKGQHVDCDVCIIEDIKNEKKEILEKNLKELEKISDSLQTSIKELKETFEKMNKDKEDLKMKIQKIFTDIRNNLNKREDELLSKVDEEFDKLIFNEKKMKSIEKLPNKIEKALKKGKNIDNDWNDDNKLCFLINDCLNIENSIKDIKIINSIGNKNINFDIKLNLEEKNIKEFIDIIKKFGDIYKYNNFLKNEIALNNYNDYKLSGENNNIITKIGSDGYRGTLILDQLAKNEINIWKIKLLNSNDNFHFYVGVAPSDFEIYESYTKHGWYFYVWSQTLWSGPPHNFCNKDTKGKMPNKEITFIMNMKEQTLKFLIDNVDYNICYNDIPIDKPLYPAIFMYYQNDSLQFIKC